MSETAVTLQRADDGALPYIETLLEENGLPAEDVRSNPERFYVAYSEDTRVGIGGLEPYGAVGLLRSVVIERPARGNGLGVALCDALEAAASENDVETLYLLTTTAAEFFANRGYVEIDRSDPPAPIQRTTEFDDLCPATATCMKKSL